VEPLLKALKSAVMGARKSPALLTMISQLSLHEKTVHLVAHNEMVLTQVIQCISVTTTVTDVGKIVFAIVTAVLDYDCNCVAPFAEMIVQCFSKRFQPMTADSTTG
jgi:hypothetical protein